MLNKTIEIGRGSEHIVTKNLEKPGVVMKRPRFKQVISLLGSNSVRTIREEISYARETIAGTGISIPETDVYPIGKLSYRILQRQIIDDQEVDIKSALANSGVPQLSERHVENPENFASSGGTIYWLDPTIGCGVRTVSRVGIKPSLYRSLRIKLRGH